MHPSTTPVRRHAAGGWLITAFVLGALLGIAVDRLWSPEQGMVERSLAPQPAQARDDGVADDAPAVEAQRIAVASEPMRGSDGDPGGRAPTRLDSPAALTVQEPQLPVELHVLLPDGSAASEADLTIRRAEDEGTEFAPPWHHAWTPTRTTVELSLGTSFVSAVAGTTLRSGERRITLHPGDRERRLTLTLRERAELHGRLRLPDPHVHAACTVELAEVPRAWRPELDELAARSIGRREGPSQTVAPSRTTFVFTDLEPGRRLVVARRSGKHVMRSIELVPGRNEIELELPPVDESVLLHVRVRSEEGHALRDARFTINWRPAGTEQLHHYGIDGDGIATTDDGTYAFPLDPTLESALRGEAKGLLELKVAAPDHAERTTRLEPGTWRYELMLPAEPTRAFTVQLTGDRDALDRGLFHVEFRRYADAGRRAWSGSHVAVDATGHAVLDHVLPGRSTLVLFVRGASFLPSVPLAEQELVIDSSCTSARFDVPPLHELTVAVPKGTEGGEIVTLSSIDRTPQIGVNTGIDATWRARFFALPAGRYSVAYGELATTVDLAASTEITLAAKSDR